MGAFTAIPKEPISSQGSNFRIEYIVYKDGKIIVAFKSKFIIEVPVRASTPTAEDFIFEMSRYRNGSQQLIGIVVGAGVVGGGIGGAALAAAGGGAGITTLTSGVPFSPTGATFAGKFAMIGSRLATMTYTTLAGSGVLNMANYNDKANLGWIQQIITNRIPVYLSSPLTRQFLVNSEGKPTMFALEVQQLLAAGYYRWGNWLIPKK